MALALFDLDNTLLNGDSDYAWGQFLVEHGIVDAESYERANQRFYELYKRGELNIHEFAEFAFQPLKRHDYHQLVTWRRAFVEEKIRPIMLDKGQQMIDRHRARGDTTIIITATNSFVTSPIADAFGVDHLIATEPEFKDGTFTGKIAGTPCFQHGKVERLRQWMEDHGADLNGSHFFSDSHNDLALLEQVDHPVAVDPDEHLSSVAAERHWPVVSFR